MQLPSTEGTNEDMAPPEFGFSSGPSVGKEAATLSWQAMRQVGAGFWLTDPQVRSLCTAPCVTCGLRSAGPCQV